jgi:hypothetical protein
MLSYLPTKGNFFLCLIHKERQLLSASPLEGEVLATDATRAARVAVTRTDFVHDHVSRFTRQAFMSNN